MHEISVVHLVWAPLGLSAPREFAKSWRENRAGVDRVRLVLLFNGLESDAQRLELSREFEGIEFDELVTPRPMIDLAAYRWCVPQIEGSHALFCNSYSRALAPDWLELFDRHVNDRNGMIGATGSFETPHTAPFRLRTAWTKAFPRFPNPHLRTTGFLLAREMIEEIRWSEPKRKLPALMLESGPRSLSEQVRRTGANCVVVGRDGRAYGESDWPTSGTFRSGEQSNLVIADNRTDDYARADAALRSKLAADAWGAASTQN